MTWAEIQPEPFSRVVVPVFVAEVHSDWLEPVPYQLLNISSITIVYRDCYILFIYMSIYVYIYGERERPCWHIKGSENLCSRAIVKPLNAVFPNCI